MTSFLFGPNSLGMPELWALFFHFLMLSLLAIGGAITTAPDMQRFVVGERSWLDDAQFTTSIAIAQAAPGPNVLFVAVIGWNVGGVAGMCATMLGSLLPSCTLALTVARWGATRADALPVRSFTTGMAPLTIGLLLSTGWVLTDPARDHPGAVALVLLTIIFMLKTKRGPMWPIAVGAVVGAMGWAG